MTWKDMSEKRLLGEISRAEWNQLSDNLDFLYKDKVAVEGSPAQLGEYSQGIYAPWNLNFTLEQPAHILYIVRFGSSIYWERDSHNWHIAVGFRPALDGVVLANDSTHTQWATSDFRTANIHAVGFIPEVPAGTHTFGVHKVIRAFNAQNTNAFTRCWRALYEVRI